MSFKMQNKGDNHWLCDECDKRFDSYNLSKCCHGWCNKELCRDCVKTLSITFEGKSYQGSYCCNHYNQLKRSLPKFIRRKGFTCIA